VALRFLSGRPGEQRYGRAGSFEARLARSWLIFWLTSHSAVPLYAVPSLAKVFHPLRSFGRAMVLGVDPYYPILPSLV
jgi:hypothetical protein